NLLARQHVRAAEEEELEHRELLGRERKRLPVDRGDARGEIELQAADLDRMTEVLVLAASEGLHPHEQLLELEGLGEVVVCSVRERERLVLKRVARGQDEHGRVRVLLPELREQITSGAV